METLITHYANVAKLRLCPSTKERDPRPPPYTAGDAATAWFWPTNYTGSYGMNSWLYTYEGASQFFADIDKYFLKDTAITSPSTMAFFRDAVWPDLWVYTNSKPARNLFLGFTTDGQIGRCTIARHLGGGPSSAPRSVPPGTRLTGGIGMSFADSHVEMVRLERLWDMTWHKGYVAPPVRP